MAVKNILQNRKRETNNGFWGHVKFKWHEEFYFSHFYFKKNSFLILPDNDAACGGKFKVSMHADSFSFSSFFLVCKILQTNKINNLSIITTRRSWREEKVDAETLILCNLDKNQKEKERKGKEIIQLKGNSLVVVRPVREASCCRCCCCCRFCFLIEEWGRRIKRNHLSWYMSKKKHIKVVCIKYFAPNSILVSVTFFFLYFFLS